MKEQLKNKPRNTYKMQIKNINFFNKNINLK